MAGKRSRKSFGAKLRELREKEGVSLEELAPRVALTPAHLTALEADRELPPVADIIRIARALSVDPSALMEENRSPGKRREAAATRTRDYAYELLSPDPHEHHLSGFRVTIDSKSSHRRVGYQHEGEEFIYVLSGRLKITVAGKSKTLEPGETIHFDSGKRHHLKNPGQEPTVLLVVLYNP